MIKVLEGSVVNGITQDISLPVALHSPLLVLKEELEALIAIPALLQVLILCDLTDPDRNSDLLLTGRDESTLLECGIRNGSVLTLHALGMSDELRQQMALKALQAPKAIVDKDLRAIRTIIPAEDADHRCCTPSDPRLLSPLCCSYNGIIFDVEVKGPFEINLTSVSIAGMLGRVRVFARDRGWEENKPAPTMSAHWWAHRESLSKDGWELIADQRCRPSWDKPLQILFRRPVRLLPHSRRAIYCHSNLPDDLGIQYQSYHRDDVVAEDEYLRLLPGLGHTGSAPFEDQHGWYRSYRGLAGTVHYKAAWKGWTHLEHRIFPVPLRSAVIAMLVCGQHGLGRGEQRASCLAVSPRARPAGLWKLPAHVICSIMEYMHYDWFEELHESSPPPSPEPQATGRSFPRNTLLHLLGMVQGAVIGTAAAAGVVGAHDDDDDEYDDEFDEEYEFEEEDDDENEYAMDEEEGDDDDDDFHDMEDEEGDQLVLDDESRRTAAAAYEAMDAEAGYGHGPIIISDDSEGDAEEEEELFRDYADDQDEAVALESEGAYEEDDSGSYDDCQVDCGDEDS